MNGIGEYQRTITVDPGGDGGPLQFDPITIEGTKPPFALPTWWPWAVAAIAIGGLWYLTREHRGHFLGGGA